MVITLLNCYLATINIILLLSHKLFALLPSVTEREETQIPTVTEHSAAAKGQTNTHHYHCSSAQGLVGTSQCSNFILADEGALGIPVAYISKMLQGAQSTALAGKPQVLHFTAVVTIMSSSGCFVDDTQQHNFCFRDFTIEQYKLY